MGLFVAEMLTSFAAFTLLSAPISAGEWDIGKASETQRSAFAYARNPFRVVIKSFSKAEKVDSSFFGK